MTPTQKIEVEKSKNRSEIASILDKPEADRPDTWQSDLEGLTKRAQGLEIELRAALVAGEDSTEETTEETPEDKAFSDLLKRSTIEDYLAESVFDSTLEGASLELRQALELPPNTVPLDLFERERRDEGRGLETRADAATNVSAADAPAENQSSIAGRIFSRTAGAYMGIARPTVPVGTMSYVALTAGTTADVRSDGVAKDAEAATFATKSVDPVRVTSRYLFGIESAARLRGMEEALRSDLTALLGDKLDALALNGQAAVANVSPAVEGLISQTTDPTGVVTFTEVLTAYSDRIDGKYSDDGENVRLLVNPETARKIHGLRIGTGNNAPLLVDSLPGGRFRASANMPDKTGEIAKALTYAAGPRRGFTQPVWRGVTIIRDPYSGAAEGQVALTIIVLAGAVMIDSGPYTQLEFQLA